MIIIITLIILNECWITIKNNNAYIPSLSISPRGSRRAHISHRSPEEDWNFSDENRWKSRCSCITKIGDIFSRKKEKQFCKIKESTNGLI